VTSMTDADLQQRFRERRLQHEEESQRRDATFLLCDIVPALAQTHGQDTFDKYTPEYAKRGKKITRAVIAEAQAALRELAAVLEQRGLL
jgi:hypothetical protein